MTATAVFIGMGLIVLVLAGLCLWLLFDVHRINRHRDDDAYPRSRWEKGGWEE